MEDVRKAAGRSDIEMGEPNVNSGGASPNGVGLKTMCIYECITPEILIGGPAQLRVAGPSLTITGILFDSDASAATHYQFGLENIRLMRDVANPGVETTGWVNDAESYLITLNSERVGSLMGLIVGPYVLSLHTTLPDGQAPLIAPDDLVALAVTVAKNLETPE